MVYAQPEATISALLSAQFNFANITSGNVTSTTTLFKYGRVILPPNAYPQGSGKFDAENQLILKDLSEYMCVIEVRKIAEKITPQRIGQASPSIHREQYCVTCWVKAANNDPTSLETATQDRQQVELEVKRVIRNNDTGNTDIDHVYPLNTYPLEDVQPDLFALGSAVMLDVWRYESS